MIDFGQTCHLFRITHGLLSMSPPLPSSLLFFLSPSLVINSFSPSLFSSSCSLSWFSFLPIPSPASAVTAPSSLHPTPQLSFLLSPPHPLRSSFHPLLCLLVLSSFCHPSSSIPSTLYSLCSSPLFSPSSVSFSSSNSVFPTPLSPPLLLTQ